MVGVKKRKIKLKNEDLRTKTKLKAIGDIVKRSKWNHVGSIWRRKDDRWEKKVEGRTSWDKKNER